MKNLYLLPTDDIGMPQNIYITSEEKIKEEDWCIHLVTKTIVLCSENFSYYGDWKKIILTTDQDLIKDGVQAIDDEFLEWFVKNPTCDEIEVGYGWIRLTETDNEGYWVSIPDKQFEMQQEEHKQENCCTPIGQIKRYIDCKGCDRKSKQETLEEASWRFNPLKKLDGEFLRAAFIKGAQWQAEQFKNKYSEEDMCLLVSEYQEYLKKTFHPEFSQSTFKQWFQQFKKK
jgi:hypothetical protein